ncbi:hypothetical protein PtA15_14A484 [Puccinia triticina]|uniref:Uncharacterized protein n=1 Tax=Puccinia triticina TaxID=208348 RepID=A0ABY7D2Z2_9BASI|nr:uncharacterized protein PtA15_14A484 [Puccinia triticina]WAQ91600.1 hypothetical protein PtA15_14A484 [Puccinia triticina]
MFASIVFPMLVLVQLVSGQVKPSSIRCATADGSQPLLDRRDCTDVFEYALTAVHLGLDECRNQPFNATIGASQPISVILDYGHNGSRCQKPN